MIDFVTVVGNFGSGNFRSADKIYEKQYQKSDAAAMQRGLGGFPHERLHQDKVALSKGATVILRRQRRPAGVSPMSDCRGPPHERLPWLPPIRHGIKTILLR
ncbi:hypothetical protein BJP34_28655 [Moorena producens PAL-8-15-08-1]|uniref:Uncharacterized protein n=1 Tax=Moorena producens PAL-8-15-08-1 TaxID=1458985 RepID=A0A1D8TZ82_9CYAN|nr:hypothetical protein BJP34_28655 [Moorena producens PAL-8-15-08-1]